MIWTKKDENCSFSWKNPAPPAEKPLYYMIEKKEDTQVIMMISMMILEERGYSSNYDDLDDDGEESNHDGEDWQRSRWWCFMVMRIFFHKDEKTELCWYWWLIALGKHDIVHTYIFGLTSRWRCPSFCWPSKSAALPKKDAIDLSFDGIRAHAFSFLINVIFIMVIIIHRVLF